MTLRRRVPLFASLVAVLLVAEAAGGCAAAREPGVAGPPPGSADAAAAESAADLEALFRERQQAARARFSEADVRFMTDMIAHHGQAVTMANMAAAQATRPAVQVLAARIRSSQVDEIAIMQQWLRDRGRPVPSVDVDGTHGGHAGHVDHAHADMPGMLTPEQFAELGRARGGEFDRLFLQRMIEHHRGALVMVQTLLAADGAAQDAVVFRLASDISVEQTAEIARMQRLLLPQYE